MFNVRLASRVMADIFLSQTFWKSRFCINHERGYLSHLLIETRNTGQVDWIVLYRATSNDTKLVAGRSIWEVHRWLKETATAKVFRGNHADEELLNNMDWDFTRKEEYEGPCDCADCNTHDECSPYRDMSIYKDIVHIPPSLIRIRVSILYEMERTYITGMNFISNDGPMTNIGYHIPGSDVTIDVDASSFNGFMVAVGSGGIRALKVVHGAKSGSSSQWIGVPNDIPHPLARCSKGKPIISDLLVSDDVKIGALEFTFDVRLISSPYTIFLQD